MPVMAGAQQTEEAFVGTLDAVEVRRGNAAQLPPFSASLRQACSRNTPPFPHVLAPTLCCLQRYLQLQQQLSHQLKQVRSL